jgi:CHAT domain-containing protein
MPGNVPGAQNPRRIVRRLLALLCATLSSVKPTKHIHEDGGLEASEVCGVRLNEDLVVLNASQASLGKIKWGDEVIGMNRVFLCVGTHTILSSLWRISGVLTAFLVKRFCREYTRTRRNKLRALRRAVLRVKSRHPHPGYWHGFILVRDYQ